MALSKLSKSELIEIILDQQELILTLQSRLSELEEKVLSLERSTKRQAAPFGRREDEKVSKRKKSGRKGGHQGYYRMVPDQVDEFKAVPLSSICPYCSGSISEIQPLDQWIEELPEIRPKVIHLRTYQGRCEGCQRVVRSHHPSQLGHSQGAAKVQLGRRASGFVLALQHQFGLSKRKVSRFLSQYMGLSLTPGGVIHLNHRLAKKLTLDYDQLMAQARQSAYIHSDETSWYVGGPKHWLWVFTNQHLTLYQVADSRGRKVIQQILGDHYPGVLISDCLNIYDTVNPLQHKCYSHHLKELSRLRELAGKDPPSRFWRKARQVFHLAMQLKKQQTRMNPARIKRIRSLLEAQADLLFLPLRDDHLEEKFAFRIRKQREHLFTFLDFTQVDPTNNLAERQLRPAVIARKISCGNRTPKGANTWKIIASIATTADQLKQDFIHTVDLAITRHLNIVRADEARFGIGPVPLNNFDLLEYGR